MKSVTAAGTGTKLVAVGIGPRVSIAELNRIASKPQHRNVILVPDFPALNDVKERLSNAICKG